MAIQLRPVYQIKVTLKNIRPPIWRRLLIPATMSLIELHRVLQLSMGWFDAHLHQFIVGREYFGDLEFDDFDTMQDETKYTISDLLQYEKDSLIYEYDFGDGWEHEVVLEKILSYKKGMLLPVCIKGKRSCPPEDVGGAWGYQEFIETISDPDDPEYEDVLEWVGGEFDPEYYDEAAINQMLHDHF